jgi:heat shock protein HtpX
MNSLKTALLLGLLSGLLVVGGGMIGGQGGLAVGLLMAVAVNFFSYFFSEKIALSMYHARPVTARENPDIYARIQPLVAGLTHRMGLPEPRLWVIPDASPNAFATGRNPSHASVACTEGLLRILGDRELEGVLAHELGHVKNRDILISSIAATIGSAITYLGYMAMFFGGRRDDDEEGSPLAGLLMFFLAPMAAGLIQMAISRTREYGADAAAARYTGSPDGLIGALNKLERGVQAVPLEATPATAHMFILNPFGGGGGFSRLFMTHPPTPDRIARLEALRGAPIQPR